MGKQNEAYKNDGNEYHKKIGKQYFFTYGYISIAHVTTPLHVHYVGIHHEKQGKNGSVNRKYRNLCCLSVCQSRTALTPHMEEEQKKM